MAAEAKHQATEILGRSYPMLLPAGLFVMQQVPDSMPAWVNINAGACSLWRPYMHACTYDCAAMPVQPPSTCAITTHAQTPPRCALPQVLVIIAATHLDAVTFQICSQSFKIMPTALFAVWLLDQHLSPIQWASLPVLAIGVVFVTMNTSNSAVPANRTSELDLLLGLAASALSGLSSAYAGAHQTVAATACHLHVHSNLHQKHRAQAPAVCKTFCMMLPKAPSCLLRLSRHLDTMPAATG